MRKIIAILAIGACLLPLTGMAQEKKVAEAVDLGLSVKWASFNLGAQAVDDYGVLYSWDAISGNEGKVPQWLKDAPKNTEYINFSGTDVDIARKEWGGKWRVPTHQEWLELQAECKWHWMEMDGVKGMLVTGKNGNSIFLPAVGYKAGKWIFDQGVYAHYWSGTLTNDYGRYMIEFCFRDNGTYYQYAHRGGDGNGVRPVTE